MAIARIATQDATGTGTTSATATYAATPTQGNLLVAVIGNNNFTLSLANSGWLASDAGASSTTEIAIYYKIAGASEPTAITMTTDGGASVSAIAIYEYNGFTGTPTLDKTSNNGTSISAVLTSSTGTTPTTTVANELLFAGVIWTNATQTLSTWSNTFTARNSVGSHLFTSDKIVAATGAYTTTATVTGTAGNTSGVIATFKDVPIVSVQLPTNYQFVKVGNGMSTGEKIR